MVILLKRKVAINFPIEKNLFKLGKNMPFQKAAELIKNVQFSLILLGQSKSTATNGLVDSDASACFE